MDKGKVPIAQAACLPPLVAEKNQKNKIYLSTNGIQMLYESKNSL
jgi:hypothetical protein